jgi:hypothetical protein
MKSFKYKFNLSFSSEETVLIFAVNKGTKAMYEVLKLGRIHSLSINYQLDLFDKMVKPTLLYGCEIWGLGNIEIIERVHIKLCKLLLIIHCIHFKT